MANLPSMRPRTFPFRGGTSSKDFNELTSEIYYDLTDLFNTLNQYAKQTKGITERAHLQNIFQQMRILQLEAEIQQIKDQWNTTQTGTHTLRIPIEQFQSDLQALPEEQATLDTFYRLATLPVTGQVISKIYLQDETTGEIILPSTLQINVSPASDNQTIIETDPKYMCGDQEYWHRKYIHNLQDPVTERSAEITITLPDNIISNRDINVIAIRPFPLNALRLDKIEYMLSGNWTLIPGFPKDTIGNPIPLTDIGYLKFHFPPTTMAKLRITLTQPHWIEEEGKKVFHLGLQELGVSYVGYLSGLGKFTIPIVLPGSPRNRLITGITPHFQNVSALSDQTAEKRNIFNYAIYAYQDGNWTYLRDTLPLLVTSSEILIKAQIMADPYTKTTPALDYVEIQYQDQ